MDVLTKIENGVWDFSEFSDDQILFIKGLAKMAYNDGVDDGEAEIKNRVLNSLDSD